MSTKLNYYMAACEVEARVGEQVFAAKVNVLTTTSVARINATVLGRIQQNAGLTYIEQIKRRGLDPRDMTVTDVIILGITPLGLFTEKEWEDGLPESAKAARAAEARANEGKPNLTVVSNDEG